MLHMKKEIESRKDIELLVNRFYDKVKENAVIGQMFAHVNWETHLPLMYNFWENAIFYSGGYNGNPLKSHQQLHQASPLSKEHFDTWLHIFTSTIDELFIGEKAELAKQRAISIATVMQIKIC